MHPIHQHTDQAAAAARRLHALADQIQAALAADPASGRTLTRRRLDTIEVLDADGRCDLVEVAPRRPVARLDPVTGALVCPHCGSTSADGTVQRWADVVERLDIRGVLDGEVRVGATVRFFDDDGADLRVGCANCVGVADLPPGLQWGQPDDR